tara:strand:+ start:805 stop:1047 length:243 start_codon:yes stop_codon:yes gene_type:complete
MSRKYVILDADEVDDVVFSEVDEDSADTLRYNVAETEVVLKYSGSKPRFLYGKTTYTHSEIRAIVVTAAWTPPFDPPDED